VRQPRMNALTGSSVRCPKPSENHSSANGRASNGARASHGAAAVASHSLAAASVAGRTLVAADRPDQDRAEAAPRQGATGPVELRGMPSGVLCDHPCHANSCQLGVCSFGASRCGQFPDPASQRAKHCLQCKPDRAGASTPEVRFDHNPSPLTCRRRTASIGAGPFVSRRSPRLRIVPRRHDEVGSIAAAVGTTELETDQRHITAPRVDELPQVGRGLVLAAAFAPDEQRDIARAQRGPGCRQAVAGVSHRTASDPA
jgi:hypothetical protein